MKSIDVIRGRWAAAIAVVGIGIIVAATVIVGGVFGANALVIVVVFLVVFVAVAYLCTRVLSFSSARLETRYAVVRRAAETPAVQAGWIYSADGPAPSREVVEAVFRSARGPLVATGEVDVITGSYRGREFRAAHLVGYEVGFGGSNTKAGAARGENIVVVSLKGLLPELRLRDRAASRGGDYGMTLPSVSSGDPALDARWDIQTPYPDFARDLLTGSMRAFLLGVPRTPCTIAVRDGALISCRDPEGSFESVSLRLTLLNDFADLIPQSSWGRATPEVAGHGAHNLLFARPSLSMWNPSRS